MTLRGLVFCLILFWATPVMSQTLPNQIPVQTQIGPGFTSLSDWQSDPARYAPNRIVPGKQAFRGARILSVQNNERDMTAAFMAALQTDGVRQIQITHALELQSETVRIFRDATGANSARYYSWTAKGQGSAGPVQAIGVALVTPNGPQVGAAVEMFVAPPKAFEALGGWAVPAVRYFGFRITDPAQDMTVPGRETDQAATTALANIFEQWMALIATGRQLSVIGTIQTLGMMQGE